MHSTQILATAILALSASVLAAPTARDTTKPLSLTQQLTLADTYVAYQQAALPCLPDPMR